ncbi:5'-3' exoribonuclease 1-like [Uloborus diversus]|uniref:5'-3' exoribonuclease 1-like n=1 Tax=Uloborus diversus TaxID=327109 RepID=UPI00240A52EB|nr:5'-3' exoribonuclease 1-like [Uloborus diversus]
MGVPKFYRWISERYPCLSEVVREHQIPDFDNLYLDMNGIIHTCSHPNDDDPHFRITEEKIFAGICHYLDFLFKMIKPRKVFFMAVDGVAPRAKMNQQRGRRFRTAKEAVTLEQMAIDSGEMLPKEARFDSNCITPGTGFMARLHTILKSFVVYKISTDILWRNVRVYLSGHETPGEGEHKIMDFIRHEKSQPNYNPNTRHCLYGLDADLIMLGLCSHEPYFSLLREEVKFGSKNNQKRLTSPEETTFHLLHISLLRDYLGHEFAPVKDKLQFEFNIEYIIDDFVLMSFLVGNDFIPHLPQLHIHHDALPVLFRTYIDVLPNLSGYINEQGHLNLERFEAFLNKLAEYDFQKFEEINDDFQYLESKSRKSEKNENDKVKTSNFLSDLGFSNMAISKTAEFDSSSEDDDSGEDDDDSDDDANSTLELEFNMHKVDYYTSKLEFDEVTPEVMRDQAEGYVRAIQWNLHYYYDGVVSWSWYYPHHYSPYISDIRNFQNMEMTFELGKPFLPFQQLLAVLPKLSKDLLPLSYQKLMCDKDSPLIDYYPDDFETDLNGKQQPWEAIVLIPFINEKLLLKFAELADKNLTEEEKLRNRHGPHLLYTYTEKSFGSMPSFLPGYYPEVSNIHAEVQTLEPDFFRLPSNNIVKGLCKDVDMSKFIIGFPTLRTLKHTAHLKNERVRVFQMVSQKLNMMLTLMEPVENDISKVADKILGKSILVSWPHLREAMVCAVSNGKLRISLRKNEDSSLKVTEDELNSREQDIWTKQVESFEEHYRERWGIYSGDVDILVSVKCLSGVKFVLSNKDGKVVEEKIWENSLSQFALQATVWDLSAFQFKVDKSTETRCLFPGLTVFILSPIYYGCMGTVFDCDVTKNKGFVVVDVELTSEPDLQSVIHNEEELKSEQYMPSYIAAQQLGLDSHFISRLTGTFLIQTTPKGSTKPNCVNIGLNLKFNRKNEEVQGFSKKKDNHWLYSAEAVKTLNLYLSLFAEFFEKLYRHKNDDVVYLEDIYPDGDGQKVVENMSNWLKSQSCSLADRQQCGMEMLDVGVVAAIDRKVQAIAKDDVYHLKKNILPSQLFSPFLCKGVHMPDPTTSFYLFDRVINVSNTTSVPLGLKGTIIGIRPGDKESNFRYQVLFDKEFMGGVSMLGSAPKCSSMSPHALINLSHSDRLKKKYSPVKTPKHVIPRLNRTNLFDSALKQLQTGNSVSPVHVLQNKTVGSNVLPSPPFYKANVDIFSTQYQQCINQRFPAPTVSPNNQQFVTPKASHANSKIFERNAPNNQTDYQSLWSDLKKGPAESSPKSSEHPIYGKQVSVEELFQGARNNKDVPKQQAVNIDNRLPASNSYQAIDALLQYCIEKFGEPPLYTYSNYGSMDMFVAILKLPNGQKIASIPCLHKPDAASNAAEKALAVLNIKQNFYNTNICDNVMNLPPPAQNTFQNQPMLFIPNTKFPPPPHAFPPFRPPSFDQPLIRNPIPLHLNHMPDAFIRTPQATPNLDVLSPSTGHQNIPSQASNSLSEREIFHLPGGGTFTVKNSLKPCDTSNSNLFVPTQVRKKEALKLHDSFELSPEDWPDLPVKKTDNDQFPSSSNISFSSKVSSEPANSYLKNSALSSPMNIAANKNDSSKLTVLKPKAKSRLAANFQNP